MINAKINLKNHPVFTQKASLRPRSSISLSEYFFGMTLVELLVFERPNNSHTDGRITTGNKLFN